jgi:hypothetical protein
MAQIGQSHNVSVFRARPKKGGSSSYYFTDAPTGSSVWYKLQGYNLKGLHKAV